MAFLLEDLLEVTRYETDSNSSGTQIGSFIFPIFWIHSSVTTFHNFPTNIWVVQLSELELILKYNSVSPPAHGRLQQWTEQFSSNWNGNILHTTFYLISLLLWRRISIWKLLITELERCWVCNLGSQGTNLSQVTITQ